MSDLFVGSKPHIKSSDTTNIIMSDVLIAMSFLSVLSFLYFGMSALKIVFISILSSYVFDCMATSLRVKKFILTDISSVVTGVVISFLMPASVPVYVPIVACFFGIVIVKQCFGGLGQNIFNPAAAGVAFVSLCWPDVMFIYPVPDIAVKTDALSQNVCDTLKLHGFPKTQIIDMLLGKQPGPMGSVHILVILACVTWLVVRKSVYWPTILSFLMSCAAVAFLFPRIHSARFLSVIYEICSGSLLFSCVFMITDPVTAPKYNLAKIVYGALIGILTMIFRYYGGFSQGACFAILLGNSVTFSLDKIIYKYFNINSLKLKRMVSSNIERGV